ncbi:MAG: DUF3450 family protein [Methylomicrobium sp.]|nr:DUF3450 family protein [Methylomicrobium sp.]
MILNVFLFLLIPTFAYSAQPLDKKIQIPSQSAAPLPADQQNIISAFEALKKLDPDLRAVLGNAVSALKKGIEDGPPFMIEERRGRMERLEKLLSEPNADLPELFRRTVEAYRVELDFAHSIDTYRALLKTQKGERLVDFLSIGRLALYYQTLDGRESGLWRNDTRQWQRLSGEGNEAIAQGLRAARKLDPPLLISLPLPGPKTP